MHVCINGEFVDPAAARVSVFDHGLLYGDGAFDTIAAVDGRIFWLDEHIDRLIEGCGLLEIALPWSRDQLIAWTRRLFEINEPRTSRLRITITRGEGEIPLYAYRACRPNLIIFGTPMDLPPDEWYQAGLRLKAVDAGRVYPRVKNLSFLPSVLGFMRASAEGADDALFVSHDGYVREGATFNIVAVRGRELIAPAAEILMGVTRAKVLDLARASGFTVRERPLPLDDLARADEAFITGTTKRIVPIQSVDGRVIGTGAPGPVTRALLARFRTAFF